MLEKTAYYAVSPHLVMLRGLPKHLGILLERIYKDPQIDRTKWSTSHPYSSRLEYAAVMQLRQDAHSRLGLSIKDEATLKAIIQEAERLKLETLTVSNGV